MASPFDIRPDGQNNLRYESLNVFIKFERTGPSTGRVSWNIPSPAAGCTSETQAYCGMLVTLDTTPPTMQKIPVKGTVYSSDPTADNNLFAGDTIGTAKVIGAFYQDRTTTFFDITGLDPNTPYYVSGYPVDCQLNYYVEGVHAFSTNFKGIISEPTSGFQIYKLNNTDTKDGGVKLTDLTGLAPHVKYQFKITLGVDVAASVPPPSGTCPSTNRKQYTITINGSNAETYEDLIKEINKQFNLLRNCPQSPLPPNTNVYFWNTQTQKLYLWDGYQLLEKQVIIYSGDPSVIVPGIYWYDPTTDTLYFRDLSSWVSVDVIKYSTSPSQPVCDKSIWFDGVVARIWNGVAWCDLTTYIQITNPSLENTAPCGSYWYNTDTKVLYKWNDNIKIWTVVKAVESKEDPNALTTGTYWFNESNSTLLQWNTPNVGWNLISQNLVRITDTTPSLPAPNTVWYKPSTKQLFVRNIGNTAWVEVDVISFSTDPVDRSSCDLWWDTLNNILYVWDTTTNTWNAVTTFFQQSNDPTLPGTFNENDIWYNPTTKTLYYWENNCFKQTEYINFPTNPITTFIVGSTIWFNTTNLTWNVWNGTGWDPVDPIVLNTDPSSLPLNTLWFDPSTNSLQTWNGLTWVSLMYTTTNPTPSIGTCWFDTTSQITKQWTGTKWEEMQPLATVSLNCLGNLEFTDTSKGSNSAIVVEDISMFKNMTPQGRFQDTVFGADEVSSTPSYKELGIGTDGSPSERYELINNIRYDLGYPTVDVELTTEQIDFCITQALEYLRQQSSIAYKRGFFFLEIRSNTQKYLLTNKAVGYNRIVSVMGAYRVTSAFLASAHGAGIYGQIVLQHLYNMVTFDLLSYHIMSEYIHLMEMLFAARLTFTWNEQKRELWLHNRFPYNERLVLLDVAVERTEQDIMTDRWIRPWIRRYATAMARLKLAEIRGKFSALPGAGGSVSLNAADLRTQAAAELELCRKELDDYIVDNPEEYGAGTQFIWG